MKELLRKTWWILPLFFLLPVAVLLVFVCREYVFHIIDLKAGQWALLFASFFIYEGIMILCAVTMRQSKREHESNRMLQKAQMSSFLTFIDLTDIHVEYEHHLTSDVGFDKKELLTDQLVYINFNIRNISEYPLICIKVANVYPVNLSRKNKKKNRKVEYMTWEEKSVFKTINRGEESPFTVSFMPGACHPKKTSIDQNGDEENSKYDILKFTVENVYGLKTSGKLILKLNGKILQSSKYTVDQFYLLSQEENED